MLLIPIVIADESRESLYGRETNRDLRVAPRHVDASRDFYFIFFERAALGVGRGGVRCQIYYFIIFYLFSRPRAGLATDTLNVRNNIEDNGKKSWL